MAPANKLEREELLAALRRLADEVDGTPTTAAMNDRGEYSVAPYYRVFGSWSAAVQAAGIKPNRSRKERSTAELLAELRRLANGSDPPSQSQMNSDGAYVAETYRAHFGSWTAALREAGLTPPTNGTRIPEADLCDALADLAGELDTTPSVTDMNDHGPYAASTYVNRFGSWDDALIAAGLTPNDRTDRIATETLLEALQQLAADLDRPPSDQDMNDAGPYHASTYYRRFESWTAALEQAGIEPRADPPAPTNKIQTEALLTELRRLATAHDSESPPTTTMMQKDGNYSPGTYVNRFGSWDSCTNRGWAH